MIVQYIPAIAIFSKSYHEKRTRPISELADSLVKITLSDISRLHKSLDCMINASRLETRSFNKIPVNMRANTQDYQMISAHKNQKNIHQQKERITFRVTCIRGIKKKFRLIKNSNLPENKPASKAPKQQTQPVFWTGLSHHPPHYHGSCPRSGLQRDPNNCLVLHSKSHQLHSNYKILTFNMFDR